MIREQQAGLAIPDEAIPHLVEGVKRWRAALVILEPWLAQQAPSLALHRTRHDIGSLRGFANYLEQQVIAQAQKPKP